MRIRYKRTLLPREFNANAPGLVIDDVVQLPNGGWIKTFEDDGREVVYRKSHWEQIPVVWRDVTHECEFCIGRLKHGLRVVTENDGYRVRKVNVPGQNAIGEHQAAFIVEKCEP